LIAYVEAHYQDDRHKNTLCDVVRSPEQAADWLRMTVANAVNTFHWSQEPGLRQWLADTRLNAYRMLLAPSDALDPHQRAVRRRLRDAGPPALENLQRLLGPPDGR
jgi:hypothetical protein